MMLSGREISTRVILVFLIITYFSLGACRERKLEDNSRLETNHINESANFKFNFNDSPKVNRLDSLFGFTGFIAEFKNKENQFFILDKNIFFVLNDGVLITYGSIEVDNENHNLFKTIRYPMVINEEYLAPTSVMRYDTREQRLYFIESNDLAKAIGFTFNEMPLIRLNHSLKM